MKNHLIQKFEQYLTNLREEDKDSGWLREAIEEISRLEGRVLEERMKVEAYEIELNKKNNPVPGKREANKKRLNELFKQMKLR